jgi:hypothetical protein
MDLPAKLYGGLRCCKRSGILKAFSIMEKGFYIVENSGSTVLSPVVTAMM